MNSATAERRCSKGNCTKILPPDSKYSTCDQCRERDRLAKRKKRAAAAGEKRKRANSSGEEPGTRPAPHLHSALNSDNANPIENDSDEEDAAVGDSKLYSNPVALLSQMKASLANNGSFRGRYRLPHDPCVNHRERVRSSATEIWKTLQYRFTVHDHKALVSGWKSRFWCSQDARRKKKPKRSDKENAKPRDTLGMDRYNCQSRLTITSREIDTHGTSEVFIRIQHHVAHKPYFDVSMPEKAAAIIRENLEFCTPQSLVAPIQEQFPQVTANQIYSTWAQMSTVIWKRDTMQIPSARILLEEYGHEVEIFDLKVPDGVEIFAWGMRRVATALKGQLVEIVQDATCEFCYIEKHSSY
jgi:hypothetical protein